MCTQASGKHARALWEAQASLRRSRQRSYAVRYAVQLGAGLTRGQGTETSLDNPGRLMQQVEGRE